MNDKRVVLNPSKNFARGLVIFWDDSPRIAITDKKGWPGGRIIVHGFCEKRDEACLRIGDANALYWGSASFPLSSTEADIVRKELEPLGLRVTEVSRPAADPLGSGKAEEAPASDRARRNDAGSLLPHGRSL